MSYYISTSTAELAYYNDLTEAAKDAFLMKVCNKHFEEASDGLKQMFSKLSSKVKKYIDMEDIGEQEKLWYSYDKTSQYFCNLDKYIEVYGDADN
jgi:hypothetical protein